MHKQITLPYQHSMMTSPGDISHATTIAADDTFINVETNGSLHD